MAKKIDNYRELPNFETKRMPTFIKQIDDVKGIVEHFVAIMGNLDAGNDVIDMGSFRKSLSERKNRVRVLDQHQTDSVLRVIGKPIDVREVGRNELTPEVLEYAPDAEGALLATTQYAINTDNGRNAYELIKGGFVDEASIGYDAVQVYHEDIIIDDKKIRTRHLKEIRLWEYSNVIFGMNPATAVVSAKDKETQHTEKLEQDQKKVTPYRNLDLAARNRAWDSDAAEGRVREWAGGADDMDWGKYQKAFLWYDPEQSEQFQGYKLPYADIVNGDLVAAPRGIFAAAGSLQGSRGTTPDIPDTDIPGIQKNIDRYYAKMREEFDDDSLIAPWNKSTSESVSKKTEGVLNITFNIDPSNIDTDIEEKLVRQIDVALSSLGIAKAKKGTALSKLLNDRIDELVTEDRSRANIITEVGQSFGSTSAVVNQILDGTIDCLTEHRAEAFAEVLDIPLSRINTALEADGCLEESAADDPEEAKEAKMHGGSPLTNVLQGNIHYAFTCLVDKWYINGYMNRDERLLLSSLIGDALTVLDIGIPQDLADRDVSYGPIYAEGYGYYGLTPDIEEKAGRILSAANAQKIQAALAHLNEVLMSAGMLAEPDEANAQHEDEDEEDKPKAEDQTQKPKDINTADLLKLIEIEREEIVSRNVLF